MSTTGCPVLARLEERDALPRLPLERARLPVSSAVSRSEALRDSPMLPTAFSVHSGGVSTSLTS